MSAGMKRPWRSRCTLAGIEARAISVKVLASRTSMNGEVFGSEEMMDDRMTPAGGRTRWRVTDDSFFFFLNKSAFESRCFGGHQVLTIILLHSSRRRDEHRLRGETRLLLPLHVLPSDDVHLRQLSEGRRGSLSLKNGGFTVWGAGTSTLGLVACSASPWKWIAKISSLNSHRSVMKSSDPNRFKLLRSWPDRSASSEKKEAELQPLFCCDQNRKRLRTCKQWHHGGGHTCQVSPLATNRKPRTATNRLHW